MTAVRISKRIISAFLAVFIMLTAFAGLSVNAAAKTSKWEGYLKISGAGDLLRMKDSNGKFYLTKDIDLKDYGLWNEEITFKGTLDGNGYCIKNLTSTGYGLFYKLSGATVQNLGLTNVNIKSNRDGVGAITYRCENTTIENCYVTGAVEITSSTHSGGGTGGHVAGMVGDASGYYYDGNNTMINCVNMADITGQYACGISYSHQTDVFTNCVNYGKINTSLNTSNQYYCRASGICDNLGTTMKSCFNFGDISLSDGKSDSISGGIAARATNNAFMLNCATVSPTDIGKADSNCMAQADTSVSASKLKKSSTYKDFDFGKTWAMSSKVNGGKPVLAIMLKNYNGSKPTASKSAGSYKGSVKVELTTDIEGGVIRYTTNGKTPSTGSKKYTGAITVDKTTTIKAAVFVNGVRAKVATLKYTIK